MTSILNLNNLFPLLLAIALYWGCLNSVNSSIQSVPSQGNEVRTDSSIQYTVSNECDHYKLAIKTKYINNEYACRGIYNNRHVVLDQVLSYSKNNNLGLSNAIRLPFPYSEKELNKGEKISGPEIIIMGVKCIKQKEELVFSIYGRGVCSPIDEFFGITSDNGDWLWYYYGNMYEKYNEFGSQDSLTAIFGDDIRNLKDLVKVYPPTLD